MHPILEELKATGVPILKISKETGIPANRMYKWYEGKGAPKHEDAQKLRAWLGHTPAEQVQKPADNSELKSLIQSNAILAAALKSCQEDQRELIQLLKQQTNSRSHQGKSADEVAIAETFLEFLIRIGVDAGTWKSPEIARSEVGKKLGGILRREKVVHKHSE